MLRNVKEGLNSEDSLILQRNFSVSLCFDPYSWLHASFSLNRSYGQKHINTKKKHILGITKTSKGLSESLVLGPPLCLPHWGMSPVIFVHLSVLTFAYACMTFLGKLQYH